MHNAVHITALYQTKIHEWFLLVQLITDCKLPGDSITVTLTLLMLLDGEIIQSGNSEVQYIVYFIWEKKKNLPSSQFCLSIMRWSEDLQKTFMIKPLDYAKKYIKMIFFF